METFLFGLRSAAASTAARPDGVVKPDMSRLLGRRGDRSRGRVESDRSRLPCSDGLNGKDGALSEAGRHLAVRLAVDGRELPLKVDTGIGILGWCGHGGKVCILLRADLAQDPLSAKGHTWIRARSRDWA